MILLRAGIIVVQTVSITNLKMGIMCYWDVTRYHCMLILIAFYTSCSITRCMLSFHLYIFLHCYICSSFLFFSFFCCATYFFVIFHSTVCYCKFFCCFCQGDSSEMFQCVDSAQNCVQDGPGLRLTSPEGDLEAYKVGTVSEEPSSGKMICISKLYECTSISTVYECTNFYAVIVSHIQVVNVYEATILSRKISTTPRKKSRNTFPCQLQRDYARIKRCLCVMDCLS